MFIGFICSSEALADRSLSGKKNKQTQKHQQNSILEKEEGVPNLSHSDATRKRKEKRKQKCHIFWKCLRTRRLKRNK